MERIDTKEDSFWDFKGQEEYIDNKYLMATPVHIVLILMLYLWFVLKFGPRYMRKRPPLNVDKMLIVYNAVQVAISCYLASAGTRFFWQHGLFHKACLSYRDDIRREITDASYLYFLSKVVELLDTVFFVLRKKQRQVTFLHVYHHTIMAFATWAIVKYSRTDCTIFTGTINSSVHIVMYAYYGLSVFPSLTKYLWWKKYITMMQLIQFTLMFSHIVLSHVYSECPPSYVLLSAVCTNTVLFMYLFGDFYVKAYKKSCEIRDSLNAQITEQNLSLNVSNISSKNGMNYIIEHHKFAGKIN